MEIIKIYEKDDIRDIFLIERNGEVEIFYKDDKPFNGKLEIYGYEEKLELRRGTAFYDLDSLLCQWTGRNN